MDQVSQLDQKHCEPCEGDVAPLTPIQYKPYHTEVPDWQVIDQKQLQKDFQFDNFQKALTFVNRVGEIAKSEGHHPDILLHDYKNVRIQLITHAIDGLSTNDFIIARRIDQLHIH